MARYRNEDSVIAMFNRFFHLCETKEQKTLVLDMKQAFLEITPSDATPQSAWISVKERLPDESCECLIVSRIGVIYLAPYSDRYKAFNATDGDDGDMWKLDNITHWMPLPEPPKGE